MAESVEGRETVLSADTLALRARTLRKARKLTLIELSARSGVSRASISKIERGEMSPTYETLRKLANGLEVAITRLVVGADESQGNEISIVRAGTGLRYGNPLYKYELLSGSPDVEGQTIFISEISTAGIDAFPQLHTHRTTDFFHVLEGRIGAHFEGCDPFYLDAGDSITFDGNRPHAFVKADDRERNPRVLWVSRPY